METMATDQMIRLGAAVLAVAALLAAWRRPLRYFRSCGFPWTYFALFAVALFAAFIVTLVAAVPVLTRLTAALASLASQANSPDGLFSQIPPLLIRFVLFVPVCGLFSIFTLKMLTYTRFLNFLPDKLLVHAALIVTTCLFLFALAGA